MSEEIWKKNRWLGRNMPGDDEAIIAQLFAALPATDTLEADGETRMETARKCMAELFARGISVQAFAKATGITGFPVDPIQVGLRQQKLMNASLVYYNHWLVVKDPVVAAQSVCNILRGRKDRAEGYADSMMLQLFVDIDSDDKQYPHPYEAGLSPQAICMEFSLGDIENNFAAIEAACRELSKKAIKELRVGLGTFGPDEYVGLSNGSMFTKRMPAAVGTEWILFKNIHRRAGKFGWFWRQIARRLDRKEEAKIAREREEHARMQEQFRREQAANSGQN